MPDIAAIIQSGGGNAWLYLPLAVLLGALHALEPGHSKSLMAAFIIAIRGTAAQAVLLGVSAAVGHTLIVWALAAIGLWFGDAVIGEKAEPWLVLVSGLLIIVLAVRLLTSLRGASGGPGPNTHAQDHAHGHDHPHGEAGGHDLAHGHVHASPQEIQQTYGGRAVTRGEIIWFGFTGGLLPCPAAIAVLLVCIHLKAFSLGIAMVAAFSIGLAITLVAVGVAAAWGTRRARAAWPGFDRFAARAPYVSGALVLLLGVVMTIKGLSMTGLLMTGLA